MTRTRRWSAEVMRKSNALDLERGVFTKRSPRAVALSLKRSAERSKRRDSSPFRSAMSMLVSTSIAVAEGCPPASARCWSEPKTS